MPWKTDKDIREGLSVLTFNKTENIVIIIQLLFLIKLIPFCIFNFYTYITSGRPWLSPRTIRFYCNNTPYKSKEFRNSTGTLLVSSYDMTVSMDIDTFNKLLRMAFDAKRYCTTIAAIVEGWIQMQNSCDLTILGKY